MLHLRVIAAAGLLLVSTKVRRIDAACSETNPCVEELGQGKPFVEPTQLSSDFKRWSIELDVDIGEVTYGWLKLRRRMYNGHIVGPTWNIRPGDQIALTLRNHLSHKGNEDRPLNVMQHVNTTNMHTHGLHISSKNPQDNVLIHVDPEESYVYRYEIHERNPSGTLWYHAHVHHSTMIQVHGGLSGMLIVEDSPKDMEWQLAAASCPLNCDSDIQMVFQPILMFSPPVGYANLQEFIIDDPHFRQDHIIVDEKNGETLTDWLKSNVNFFTTNGLLQPVMPMATRRLYRFRMVNAAGFDALEIFITKKGSIEGTPDCDIREIAVDGVYLDKPRKLQDGQTLLAPGQRTDWLVKCNKQGTYELRSHPRPENEMSIGVIGRFGGILVTLEVGRFRPPFGPWPKWRRQYAPSVIFPGQGLISPPLRGFGPVGSLGPFGGPPPGFGRYPPRKPSTIKGFRWNVGFPKKLPERPDFVKDLRRIREEDIDERFVMEFNTRVMLNRKSWSGPDDYRYKMTVGKVQEWHVVNTDSVDSHPLHIHINHVQVIAYNTYTGPFSLRFEENFVLYDQVTRKPCDYQREGLEHIFEEEVPDGTLRFLGHEERYKANEGNTLGYARIGDWRDTVLIPPLSNITIRFLPERYTGDCIIHCHILGHEDGGMMMITEIVEEGESREANIPSGEAYPGTCNYCDRYPFNNPQTLCYKAEFIESSQASAPRETDASPFSANRLDRGKIPTIWHYKVTERGEGVTRRYNPARRVVKD